MWNFLMDSIDYGAFWKYKEEVYLYIREENYNNAIKSALEWINFIKQSSLKNDESFYILFNWLLGYSYYMIGDSSNARETHEQLLKIQIIDLDYPDLWVYFYRAMSKLDLDYNIEDVYAEIKKWLNILPVDSWDINQVKNNNFLENIIDEHIWLMYLTLKIHDLTIVKCKGKDNKITWLWIHNIYDKPILENIKFIPSLYMITNII